MPHEVRGPGRGQSAGARNDHQGGGINVKVTRRPGVARPSRRLHCPAGCPPSYHAHPGIGESMPSTARNLQAARRTWVHLAGLGYLGHANPDDTARQWWLNALGVAS